MFNPLNLFKKKIGLLPYIREDVHELTVQSVQHYGWELRKFNIPDLWKKTEGYGITVAVIDTGVDYNHEDLRDNMLEGKNFVEPNEPPIDRVGHGTHVASTIAGVNNGLGMVGVAPKTKIMPVKALGDDGSGNISDISQAIRWAADQHVDFITMSLGSPGTSRILENAIKYAYDKGCVIFCAAGNSGEDSDVMYPAAYDTVIAIGAIDQNLERTSFTCSGPSLDFLAPGDRILGCVPGNRYALMSGTSMSNPFAVGCASLLLSYKKQNGQNNMSLQDYLNIFGKTAIPLKNPKYRDKKYQGYGILTPCLS
jgi:subtilisin family serine protease